jgi:hypothetical protein
MEWRLASAAVILLPTTVVMAGCGDRQGHREGETARASAATATTTATTSATSTRPPVSVPVTAPPPRQRTAAPQSSIAPATARLVVRDTAPARRESTVVASTSTAAVVATPPPPPKPSALAIALGRLPFGNTERLEYQVKYGFLGVGSAVLEILGMDSVRGAPAIHATFTVKGGVRVYRVNDRYESWFDPATYSTLRAVQNIDEGSYDRQRNFEFFPDRKIFTENDKPEAPTVADPLDEASFIFFLRSIPLDVGQTYEFTRYFRPDKNPVRVVVVRKDTVKVPAGTFSTIVVRPTIKTTGIFGEGGRAEVWFSDDSTRTLVQLKSSLKFGSLNLYLRNRRAGTPWLGAATAATPAP